ncbi:hypothetical protein [Senegalia massiliensis]|uniref:Uncharacterized protein n=1 Tax=Senegalia massiliensis TaxID=1720316 RepID=A0A845R2P3_9CLOT|nr:hypothetical protein [Senegalia massiliensis]NBI08229.1 hypothetical protein [Senegalia massiliensis]
MNLIEQSLHLNVIKEKLDVKTEKTKEGKIVIINWIEVSNALNKLLDFDFLRKQAKEIFQIDDIINIRIDRWITDAKTHKLLIEKIGSLKKSIEACIGLIEEYTKEDFKVSEGKGLVHTRMPDDIDMKKMSKITSNLDKVFNQCPLINDKVKFMGVEKGSVYFVFGASILTISVLGKLLNAALDVQRKYYQNQMLKNKLETMDNISDTIEPIIEELENEVKEYSREKANAIDESGKLEPENIERLSLSIKILSELIGQGVEMQCSLYGEQENMDISFPLKKDFKNLLETTKMINGN